MAERLAESTEKHLVHLMDEVLVELKVQQLV
jgi:hypothetical protein